MFLIIIFYNVYINFYYYKLQIYLIKYFNYFFKLCQSLGIVAQNNNHNLMGKYDFLRHS